MFDILPFRRREVQSADHQQAPANNATIVGIVIGHDGIMPLRSGEIKQNRQEYKITQPQVKSQPAETNDDRLQPNCPGNVGFIGTDRAQYANLATSLNDLRRKEIEDAGKGNGYHQELNRVCEGKRAIHLMDADLHSIPERRLFVRWRQADTAGKRSDRQEQRADA